MRVLEVPNPLTWCRQLDPSPHIAAPKSRGLLATVALVMADGRLTAYLPDNDTELDQLLDECIHRHAFWLLFSVPKGAVT